MKNFTKKITSKPLFKPTRWLIMSFMLLLGVSSTWGANNATKSDGSYRFYFQFNGGDTWWNNSGCNHYAWVWANGAGGQIQRIYKLGTTSNASTGNQSDVFYMNIPNNMVLHGMILFRGNPSKTNPTNGSTSFPAEGTYYNKTNDIILTNDISSKNYITAVSNGSSNVSYSTYKTVSVVSKTLSASNAKSGSGTQADPYVYDENSTMKLSASATIDDHNFSIQLAYSSSTATITSGKSKSIDVALTTAASATAYTVTYTPLLGGSTSYKGTASTETIYYKTEKSCTTVDAPDVTATTPICSGSTSTLTLNNKQEGVTYKLNSTSGETIFADGNTYTTPELTEETKYTIIASHADACENDIEGTVTVSLKPTPTKPAITLIPDNGNIVAGNSATLSVNNPVDGYTYTLYETTRGEIESGMTSFTISDAGNYYVKATNDCQQESPASEEKEITVCTPNATLLSATYNQETDKIDLRGNLTETCGKTIYYGFLWKVKDDDWNTNNAISGTGNSYNSTSTNNTEFNQSWDKAVVGTTYVFTAYALNTATNPDTWYYDETGIEVSKCINIATPDIDPVAICSGSTATLTLKNKQNGVTYTLLDGTETPIFTDGTTHTVKPNGTTTYTITATSDNSCTPGQPVTKEVTVTVNAMPSLSPSVTVTSICEGETKTLKVNTNATSIEWYKNETLIDGQTTASLSITTAGTYKVVVSNASGCSKEMSFTVANAFGSDITPTITGATSVQSGAAGIIYSTAYVDNAAYKWQIPTGWTFSGDEDGNQITVSAPSTEGNGTITVDITKNGCTKTATLNVTWAKGYTVYVRRPHAKNETTDYNAWFEKTAEAGPGYIKFGTVIKQNPGATNIYKYNGGTSASAKDPNEVAVRGTEAFTDCEGHVWDAYSIGLDVKDIYFRAPNDKSASNTFYSGYNTYTWSYSQNTPIAEDLYFTMGPKNTTGMTLNKVEKPFEGIEIDALGSTEICSNNMASFAALYLKSNCTGQDITAYAWKFSTNNSSWGEYTTGKGANTNNIRPNKAGYYHLECTLKDGSVVTSNSIQIKTTTCSISNASLNNITSNLPIIMVNTGDKAFPSVDNGKHCSASADDLKKKRSVDVKILWNKNGTVTSTDAYSNGANLYYDRKARMNYRGSSSLNFEKKSFAFCPGDEMCGDDEKGVDYVKTKKMNMFNIGSAEDKDWVLYAAYPDPSMMRNILAMETYSAMTGKWGVKNQYVELYIDGEYQGVYVFMDKITKNDNRVNIKWEIDKSDDSKSRREFILKFDKTDVADRYEDASGDQKTFESDMTGKTGINTYDTTVDQRFEIEYPEKEDIEEDYGEGAWAEVYTFISGKVNEFEKAIADGDFNKVRNLINYESWADFFIINEFTKNVDAYRASCVFVFKDGKFEAWPLWDYELSFNNTVTGSGKGRGETTGLLIEHSDVYSDAFPAPFWWTGKYNGSNMYSGLLKDPCFIQMIVSRWAEHTKEGGPLHPNTTITKTGAYKTKLDANGAATRETTKWPINSRGKDACNNANTGYFANGGGGANTTYENSYKELNKWLAADQRLKGLDDAIKNLAKIIEFGITATADKDETTPWRAVNVKVDAIGAGYTYTVTPAITRGQVIQGDGNLLIYAEELGDYEVTTTLDAKDQCGSTGENASAKVEFSVKQLEAVCPEP